VTEKGVPNLLMAVERLRSRFPDVRLDLVGTGRDEESLKQMSTNLGLDAHVRFRGRMDDVSGALRSSDIYVQPSLNEGLPNSLLEAMASALPVVVTRVGGMPDVVADGIEGFVVSPGDADELAQAIGKLLENEKLRRKMGAKACAKIQREFSIESVSDQYINQYKELVTA
jgi:glycosyltransferase involved in cell wall biosynthesis